MTFKPSSHPLEAYVFGDKREFEHKIPPTLAQRHATWLVQQLYLPNHELQLKIGYALSSVPLSRAALRELQKSLEHPDPGTQITALKLLALHGRVDLARRHAKTLIHLFSPTVDSEYARSAAEYLVDYTTTAAQLRPFQPVLERALDHDNVFVRAHAAEGLTRDADKPLDPQAYRRLAPAFARILQRPFIDRTARNQRIVLADVHARTHALHGLAAAGEDVVSEHQDAIERHLHPPYLTSARIGELHGKLEGLATRARLTLHSRP